MKSPNDIVALEGFEQLLSSNEPRLNRIAHSYGGVDWQDLLQEIHLQLWRSRERFVGKSAVGTWLYRVALNTAISFNRGKKILTRSLDGGVEQGTTGLPLDQSVILREFLASLNQANRAVLLLFLEGLSNEEIADVFATSAGSVATRLTRLKQQFETTYVETS